MKVKPTPTSPKEKNKNHDSIENLYHDKNLKMIDKPEKGPKISVVTIILLSILFGFFAGVLGDIFINYYAADIPFIKELGFFSFLSSSSVVIHKVSNSDVLSSQDFSKIMEKTNQTQVSIFLEKSSSDLSSVYLPSEQKGMGIAVSSDGLFLTSDRVVDDLQKNYVAVTYDNKIYKMLEITSDPVSGAVFFRLEVNNFPVNQFSDNSDLANGQTVILTFNQNGQSESLKLMQVINKSAKNIETKSDLIDSSEILNKHIIISENQSNILSGSSILNTNGEVIGLLVGDNEVMPINFIKPALDSLLASKNIQRPYLGVHYIDLSEAVNLPNNLTQGQNQGALIYSDDPKNPAIEPGSLAQKVGLKEKDIILQVDDTIINQSNNLSEIIQNYKPGSVVDVVVLRNQKKQTIKLELEALP